MEQTVTSAPGTDGLNPPDPHPDQPGQPVPENIAEVLFLVRLLAAWGRHLAGLLPQRGLWQAFATVARFLGGETMSDTLARIHRGILRVIALERVLLERATRGRDLKVLARPSTVYVLTPEMFNDEPEEAPTEAAQAEEPPAEADAPQRLTRPVRPERFDDRRPIWLDALPSLAAAR